MTINEENARIWQIYSIKDIKAANEKAGQHFFSNGAMNFFGSKVNPSLFYGSNRVYFITSEKRPNSDDPRFYSVREFNPDNGRCETAKGTLFQEFVTLGKAKSRAAYLARMIQSTTPIEDGAGFSTFWKTCPELPWHKAMQKFHREKKKPIAG